MLPDINNQVDSTKRSTAERQAVNSIIQGSASDLIKFAMIACVAEIKKLELVSGTKSCHAHEQVKLIMQIHDELIFEAPETDQSFLQTTLNLIKNVMEKVVREKLSLKVPLLANVSIGKTWGTTESWEPNCT